MTIRVLLASLAVGAAALPAGAPPQPVTVPRPVTGTSAAAVEDLTIRSVTLRPPAPVVGPADSVRMVVEVVARGVTGPEGVTIKVEPGAPPGSVDTFFPLTAAHRQARPGRTPASRPGGGPGGEPRPAPRPGHGHGHDRGPALAPGPAPVPSASARLGAGVGTWAGAEAGAGAGAEAGAGARAGTGARTAPPPGGGWETWRFVPEKSLSRWYPAGPWTVTVTAKAADGTGITGYRAFLLKRLTRFGGVEVVRQGPAVRVTGVLNRVDPQGHLDYAPFPAQPVEILHRPGREHAWTTVAEVVTGPQGRLTRTVQGRTGGEWRLRFEGTSRYAPRTGVVHRVVAG
ncbi:hypothetical protein [Streptosporangium sp. NPDC023615]|uniref:hypothetical protein n=1 Tax=Streptosporangium sp. NPDC023615 TaxID=3154794 RepID=UPI0034129FC7